MSDTQGISQEMIYLSQKKAHLNAPGYKLNSLYYSSMNSMVDLVENTVMTGRYSQTLSSTQFNSSSTITIPNSSFLGQMYLHLELPNLVADQQICRGWGLACLESISFLMGSSNVPQLEISGESIRDVLMLQSESAEKASEIIRLAGDEYRSPIPTSSSTRLEASVLIPTPFSSMATLHQKKYFDTNLLNNPITIHIKFKNSDSIYGGSGVRPSGFNRAVLFTRQAVLSNKDLSLKNKLMQNPSLVSNYPFLHRQSYSTQTFQGRTPASGQKISLSLLSFINADLLGIVLSIRKTSKARSVGVKVANPLDTDDIIDCDITYNGQSIHLTPGTSYKLTNMCGMVGASYYHNSIITDSGADSIPKDCYLLYADFSQKRPDVFNNEYQNTFRIPNNTLNVTFYTPTSEEYQMHATYVYNGMLSVASDGTSRIYLD